MKTIKHTAILLLFAVLLFVCFVPLGACQCKIQIHPNIKLTITNNTETEINLLLYIYTTDDPYQIGILGPGQSIKYLFEEESWVTVGQIYFTALDDEGYLVFSRLYKSSEIQGLGNKIIITDEPKWHQTFYWTTIWGPIPWKTR